jgi:putative PIN family toxin of toxin-antitoxin system
MAGVAGLAAGSGGAKRVAAAGVTRLVLDTNVWLDWLVFDDATIAPLREAVAGGRAEVYMDEAADAELERVLAYDLGKRSIDAAAQATALAACRRVAHRVAAPAAGILRAQLPRCRDPHDQKFLELALAAQADVLVTKDQALLELARRKLPFRIAPPQALGAL